MASQHELRSFGASLASSSVKENARDVLAPILVHAEKLQVDLAAIAERCNVSSFRLAKWKSGELKPDPTEAKRVVEQICFLVLEKAR